MIKIGDIVRDTRRAMDEFTLNSEFVGFDADFEDVVSSNFSDEDIADRALDVARHIAARTRAAHLADSGASYVVATRSGLIQQINPTEPDDLNPPGATTARPLLRLLASRVWLTTAPAARRTFSSHLTGQGRTPTAAKPIYVYSDHEFFMSAGAAGEVSSEDDEAWTGGEGEPGTAKADVVLVPYLVSNGSGTEGEFKAMATPGIQWYNGSDWSSADYYLPMDDKYRRPIVNGVVSSCFLTLRKPTLAASYRRRMMDALMPFLLPRYQATEVPEIKNM